MALLQSARRLAGEILYLRRFFALIMAFALTAAPGLAQEDSQPIAPQQNAGLMDDDEQAAEQESAALLNCPSQMCRRGGWLMAVAICFTLRMTFLPVTFLGESRLPLNT
ncbi:MAG: hypothetical protein QGG09_15845 [Pirellulaceae bacterium]|nr:hypothetical protein [Pirellulaceae bacterium]HJN12441.1 hypothetical protein [Pirellulaceae bacterium]